MIRLDWLARVLRGAGLDVVEHEGWQARGVDIQRVDAVVCHHTATGPNWTDGRVASLLINGRPDLKGPLSQLGLDRRGRFHVLAAGRCNHNGRGTWGNQSIGIEAFNDGLGEPWPADQLRAYHRGVAAICSHLRLPVSRVLAHRETDPTRKIDPRGIDMNRFRIEVARLVTPLIPPKEARMALNKPACRIIFTPSGLGYWIVAQDGGVFAFGDAPFLGSLGDIRLNAPIVDAERTPSGQGLALLGADGGVFTFGDASFLGSAAG